MTNFRILLTTTSSPAEADRIATALVDRRLATCVNILPGIQSVYRWQGDVERIEELLLLIKTEATLVPQIELALRELHSYEVPECITLPILEGSTNYLAWFKENLK